MLLTTVEGVEDFVLFLLPAPLVGMYFSHVERDETCPSSGLHPVEEVVLFPPPREEPFFSGMERISLTFYRVVFLLPSALPFFHLFDLLAAASCSERMPPPFSQSQILLFPI